MFFSPSHGYLRVHPGALSRRCAHPKTGSGDPQHQMLLKEGVGTVWGRKVPPSATGSHNASEACPPTCGCQPQRPRPTAGRPLGEQLHCLCCSIKASSFKVNTATPSNCARQAISAHVSNSFSQPKLFLKDGSV